MEVLEEALQAAVVGVDLGSTRKGGGELGQIDGFDPESSSGQAPEQGDDKGGQTGDASAV